jgi:hypothetical protein
VNSAESDVVTTKSQPTSPKSAAVNPFLSLIQQK